MSLARTARQAAESKCICGPCAYCTAKHKERMAEIRGRVRSGRARTAAKGECTCKPCAHCRLVKRERLKYQGERRRLHRAPAEGAADTGRYSAWAWESLRRIWAWFRAAEIRESGPQVALSCRLLDEYARLNGEAEEVAVRK